jgi:hypothetical protein
MATKPAQQKAYPASFTIDYPAQLDRLSTFFRIVGSVPAFILLSLLVGSHGGYMSGAGKTIRADSGGIVFGLTAATALMIVFRQRYPRWWFDFNLELNRFSARVSAYLFLLTDQYPSATETQAVHLDIAYPTNVARDLNRWLPLVKWLLAVPHYIVLALLSVVAVGATIVAWFVVVFTGRYPRGLFDFVVGVGRWSVRVGAYAWLLTTDEYPPFSLQ